MKNCSTIALVIAVLAATSFPGTVRGQTPPPQAQATAIPLKRVDAAKSVKKLRALLGDGDDVEVSADEGTNTIFIRARPERVQKAKEILDQLDVGVPSHLTIFTLKRANAARTSGTLQAILTLAAILSGDDNDIIVTADGLGNNIIIWATEYRTQQAKDILPWLDLMRP